jgi:cell division protein FtsB
MKSYKNGLKLEKQRQEALQKEKIAKLKELNDLKTQIKTLKQERDFILDAMMARQD